MSEESPSEWPEIAHIAIICMIPNVELRALLEVLQLSGALEIRPQLRLNYHERLFQVRTAGGLDIGLVLVCCEGQSNLEAALTTQITLYRHSPRYAFLCRIGGGLKLYQCKLGDVVVGCEVVHRRFTKIGASGEFKPEVSNIPASDDGRRLIQRLFSTHPHPQAIQSGLNDGALFAIHAEKILSWDYVLDHGPTRTELLRDLDRQLAIVEMEGAGFLKAVHFYSKNYLHRPRREDNGEVGAVIVRGISDPAADKAASDAAPANYRLIATRNAAQTVFLMIDSLVEGDFAIPPF